MTINYIILCMTLLHKKKVLYLPQWLEEWVPKQSIEEHFHPSNNWNRIEGIIIHTLIAMVPRFPTISIYPPCFLISNLLEINYLFIPQQSTLWLSSLSKLYSFCLCHSLNSQQLSRAIHFSNILFEIYIWHPYLFLFQPCQSGKWW